MRARVNKRHKRQVIYKGNFLQFIQKGEWEFVKRSNCTAIVIIVPQTDDGQVVFIEQYRAPVDKKVIEFPAGLVNDGPHKRKESIVTAAKRELLEETGYRAKSMKLILEGPVSSGSSADIVSIFMAVGAHKVSNGGGDAFESIIVHKIPFEQTDQWLDKMRGKGCLVEPKIYTGLYFLSLYNRKSLHKKISTA